MAINLKALTSQAVGTVFGLGTDWVKDARFYRPASFNSASGMTIAGESMANCKMVVLGYRPAELGLVSVQPEDEKALVRASELTGISEPGPCDYLVETSTSLRRDILCSRLDPSGEFWMFQTVRVAHQDWGDLSAVTDSEDRGDLTAVTDFEDCMTLV